MPLFYGFRDSREKTPAPAQNCDSEYVQSNERHLWVSELQPRASAAILLRKQFMFSEIRNSSIFSALKKYKSNLQCWARTLAKLFGCESYVLKTIANRSSKLLPSKTTIRLKTTKISWPKLPRHCIISGLTFWLLVKRKFGPFRPRDQNYFNYLKSTWVDRVTFCD